MGYVEKIMGMVEEYMGMMGKKDKEDPVMCCKAMTASCLACSHGVSIEEVCAYRPDVTGCPKDDNRLIDEENKKQDKKKYKWGEKEVTVKDKKDDKKTSDFDSYIKDRFAFDHNQLMNKQKKDKEAEKNQMDKKREDLEKQKQTWL